MGGGRDVGPVAAGEPYGTGAGGEGGFPILCVTDRKLCAGDFLDLLARIAAARPAGIILREKDLDDAAYEKLARQVLACCGATPLIVHGHPDTARALRCTQVHMPLSQLERLSLREREGWDVLSTSCHSLEEARRAVALGCTRIIVGHIFDTRCKPGVPPRGLAFLREICRQLDVDVYAIGGITPRRVPSVREAGADGACMRGAFMQTEDPRLLLAESMAKGPSPVGLRSSSSSFPL